MAKALRALTGLQWTGANQGEQVGHLQDVGYFRLQISWVRELFGSDHLLEGGISFVAGQKTLLFSGGAGRFGEFPLVPAVLGCLGVEPHICMDSPTSARTLPTLYASDSKSLPQAGSARFPCCSQTLQVPGPMAVVRLLSALCPSWLAWLFSIHFRL